MNKKGFLLLTVIFAIVLIFIVSGVVWYFSLQKVGVDFEQVNTISAPANSAVEEKVSEESIQQKKSNSPALVASEIQKPPPTNNKISVCGIYTDKGEYQLNSDLLSANPGCLKINGANNLILDCQGHTIKYAATKINVSLDKKSLYTDSATDYTTPLLDVQNAQDSVIKNCVLETDGRIPLSITKSKNLTIKDNTINESPYFTAYVEVRSSNAISFVNNTVHVFYDQLKTVNSYIGNNVFLWNQPSKINKTFINSVLDLSEGSSNTIENNTINGSADGDYNIRIGADHGIGLTNEKNDVVSKNNISHSWFLGLETSRQIENSLIDGNLFDTIGAAGIGSIYGTSWINNKISNNTVENAGLLFHFTREGGLLVYEDAVYFKDNAFINNNFKSYTGKYGSGESSSFHFQSPFWLQTDAERQPTTSEIILTNNLFQGNNFNKDRLAPLIYPASMVKDGGGNICGDNNQHPYPLLCN
ncbi:MAG: right-handed parallel beta-helix repeat-containing protein [Candidatus Paceibacterota bacterium]|jgi:hypothetical protein